MKRLKPFKVQMTNSVYSTFALPFVLFITLVGFSTCDRYESPDYTINYPQTFKFASITHSSLYVRIADINGDLIDQIVPNTSTFKIFSDTIQNYISLSTSTLGFSGIELMNESELRFFSEPASGLPPLDTVLPYRTYFKNGSKEPHFIVPWRFGTSDSLFLAFSGYDGQSIQAATIWCKYSYPPFGSPSQIVYSDTERFIWDPRESGGRTIFNAFRLQTKFGADVRFNDTVSMHRGNFLFE